MMGSRKKLLATSLLALPGIAGALGLGSIEVKSGLNEPLRAEIQVVLSSPEEKDGLNVAMASPEDFSKVGLDFSRVSVPVNFKVATNARGQTVIEVSSSEAVREPFMSLLVEVNWSNGRLLREFSVLLDPPVMASARGSSAAPASSLSTQPLREDSPPSAEPLQAQPVAEAPPAPEPEPQPEPIPEPQAPAASEPVVSQPAPQPEPLPEPTPEPLPEPTPEPTPEPVASTPPSEPVPEPASDASSTDQYGPTAPGDSLFTIARQVRPGIGNADQLMVAILRANPQAFYQDNINALKKGAILRIPSESEYLPLAEAQEVAREHNALWREYQSRAAGNTTLVSDAGSSSIGAESGGQPSVRDRLELLAPSDGDGQGGADRPGAGSASNAEEVRGLRDDLASAREELSSSQREAGELRSRVSDLEKLQQDQNSLITMKDDRIAELEERLKQLEAESASAATPAPESAPVATTPAVPDASKPEISSASTPEQDTGAGVKPPSEDDIWAAEPVANEPKLPDGSADPALTSADEGATTASTDGASEPPVASTEPAPATGSETTPVAGTETTPVAEPEPAPVAEPEPAPVAEPEPAPAATAEPAPAPEAGFLAKFWPYLAGGAGVLGLLGFLALRRKSGAGSETAESESAVDFGIPAPAPSAVEPQMPTFGVDEGYANLGNVDPEVALRSAIESDPGNLQAHAELLRMFYERGDGAAFEDGAQAMFAQVLDTNAPEWQYVKDMGMELVPDSALFASAPDFGTLELPPLETPASDARADEGLGSLDFDSFSATPAPAPAIPAPPAAVELGLPDEPPAFDFDLNLDGPTKQITPVPAPVAAAPAASSAADDLSFDFSFDLDSPAPAQAPVVEAPAPVAPAPQEVSFEAPTLDLPSFDFDDIKPPEKIGFASPELEPAMPSAPSAPLGEPEIIREPEMSLDDSLFGGSDDAVGTKLDLARAYLDMGDPDGARGMLEEVLLEGSEQQRSDAQELLARI